MLHVLYFITRKTGLTDAEFHRYWREVHGPIAKKIPQLKSYVQTHRIPFPGGAANSPYDGAAEVMIENEAALEQLRREPAYLQGALVDEAKFIDLNRVEWQVTTDHVMIDGATRPGMAKAVFQVRGKPGLSLPDFKKYWLNIHGPIVKKCPGFGATSSAMPSRQRTLRQSALGRSSGAMVRRRSGDGADVRFEGVSRRSLAGCVQFPRNIAMFVAQEHQVI